jgi:hypothetical protein
MPEEPIPRTVDTQPQLEAILKSLGELTQAVKSRQSDKPKDTWDKVNALSPFVTGLIVAIVGGLFTFNEGRRNELLKQQEIAAQDRAGIQDSATKEHQARVLELQTIAQFMPYLTSRNEDSKQAAITAIKALSNASLAIELAALNKSPGTVRAVRQIAAHSTNETDRRLAQAALVELEKSGGEGPNRTLLKTEAGDCGPEGDGGDRQSNILKNRTDSPPTFRNVTAEDLVQLEIPDVSIFRDSWTLDQASKLKSLGDGQAVRVQGFLIVTKPQSHSTGTSANCHLGAYFDWRLYIGSSPNTLRKDTLAAVAGPRIRLSHPNWTLERLQSLQNAGLAVRLSGWLFFNGEHRAQLGEFMGTLWEVRPVLKIEFLKGGSWFDLDQETP